LNGIKGETKRPHSRHYGSFRRLIFPAPAIDKNNNKKSNANKTSHSDNKFIILQNWMTANTSQSMKLPKN